jgi:hypothetical protein
MSVPYSQLTSSTLPSPRPKLLKNAFKTTLTPDLSPKILPIKETRQSKKSSSIEATKNQFKLDLTVNHNILRAMAFANDEQEALKDNSSLSHGFKRMSAGMNVLRDSDRRPSLISTVMEHIQPLKSKEVKGALTDLSAARHKWIGDRRRQWIKARGMDSSHNESRAFVEFLKNLYGALDEDRSGKLSANDVVLPLLAYGLCPDSYYIEAVNHIIGFKSHVQLQ